MALNVFLGTLVAVLSVICIGLMFVLFGKKSLTEAKLRSVTRWVFVSTHISAVVWVYISYAIAIYATIRLGQVYTMAELSKPAIEAILGVAFLKVLSNIFEHNNGSIWGTSKKE